MSQKGRRAITRLCEMGNKRACYAIKVASMGIYCGAVTEFNFSTEALKENPNAMPWSGTLLLVDQPSTKPPHGARGHRIYVPKDVAEKRVSGLVGMGVNYDPGDLNEHVPRHKVGVITGAKVVGNKVKVDGIVYVKDFPEAAKDLKKPGLGMSMELANVYVRDENEDVWYLQDFHFTGATILKKDAAAYYGTSLAAKAAAKGEGEAVDKSKKKAQKTSVAAAGLDNNQLADAIAAAMQKVNEPVVKAIQGLRGQMSVMASSIAEQNGVLTMLASAQDEEEVEQDDDEVIHAAKSDDDDDDLDAAKHDDDDDDDDDDMDAAKSKKSDDESDDEDDDEDDDTLDAELEDLEEKAPVSEPGKVNHNMKTKGRKSTTTKVGAAAKPFPNLKSSASISAAAVQVRTMKAAYKKQLREIKASFAKSQRKTQNTIDSMQAQLDRYADQEDRRSQASIPTELHNLAAKVNIDLHDIKASGQKLTVNQVDSMFAAAGLDLDPTQRMAMKNRLLQAGLMEQGEVVRVN